MPDTVRRGADRRAHVDSRLDLAEHHAVGVHAGETDDSPVRSLEHLTAGVIDRGFDPDR